ncbi:hypothetical protein CEXT_27201 [Caerostris extrusa]|uniref:Uncharacterized protein n=1 Tax=Caerostris extrusa TaxID=172846 RepID=A0AAV4QWA2_CAEEX|nr:hypothetical protein CEXT_27201 [Caerostris extrusa]
MQSVPPEMRSELKPTARNYLLPSFASAETSPIERDFSSSRVRIDTTYSVPLNHSLFQAQVSRLKIFRFLNKMLCIPIPETNGVHIDSRFPRQMVYISIPESNGIHIPKSNGMHIDSSVKWYTFDS